MAITSRGGVEDLCYTGHIMVVDSSGKIISFSGRPEREILVHSSSAFLQALLVLESGAAEYYGITDQELAAICSSYSKENYQVETIKRILEKAGLDESFLQCMACDPIHEWPARKIYREGGIPIPSREICSGTCAGMLITARYRKENLENYHRKTHPYQQRMVTVLSEMCEYPVKEIKIGTDRYGEPFHGMPVYHFAFGLAKFADPKGLGEKRKTAAKRIIRSIQDYPFYVSGTNCLDARINGLIRKNVFSKSGADGYYGIGILDKGWGIVVKVDCGLDFVRDAIVVEILRQLGEIRDGELALFQPETERKVYNYEEELPELTKCCFQL